MPNNIPENPTEQTLFRKIIGICLLPLATFPFLALISYDWRGVSKLCIPCRETSQNLIGPLGDAFAYYGYTLVGLAVWTFPIICIILGLRLVLFPGRRFSHRLKIAWWSTIAFISVVSILQLLSSFYPIKSILSDLNIAPNAGGAIGYLLMTRFLASIVSPFGAIIIMISLFVISMFFLIGFKRIINLLSSIVSWAADKSEKEDPLSSFEEDAIPEQPKKEARKTKAKPQVFEEEEEEALLEPIQKPARKPSPLAEETGLYQPSLFGDDFDTEDSWLSNRNKKTSPKRSAVIERNVAESDLFSDKSPVIEQELPAVEKTPKKPKLPPNPVVEAPVKKKEPVQETIQEEDAFDEPYVLPSIDILAPLTATSANNNENDIESTKQRLLEKLSSFGVEATIAYTVVGPVVTQYAVQPANGVRFNKITNLHATLQGALEAKSLRIIAPIPGKNAVGIEVPNETPAPVSFREIIESEIWRINSYWPKEGFPKFFLPLLLGKDSTGKDLVVDLAKIPHLLVAGATGQGKSVCLNSIINGLLMCRTPDQLRLIMVDPKRVEFTSYETLPHLLVPIVNDTNKVVFALRWAVNEMNTRLKLFAKTKCRNISDFNSRKKVMQPAFPGFGEDEVLTKEKDIPSTIPYIVIIIDELADIMQSESSKDVEASLARLLALARATGIHLILATQRPDTKVITGTIKSNIPGRIAFKTSQGNDSRTIVDSVGAEQLIGKGDMLFKTSEGTLLRAQGAFISDGDIDSIITFISEHSSQNFDEKLLNGINRIKESTEETEDISEDESSNETSDHKITAKVSKDAEFEKLCNAALEIIASSKRASTSYLQRRLSIGYNNAARVIEELEMRGYIGPQKPAGPRDILVDPDEIKRMLYGNELPVSLDDDGSIPVEEPIEDTPSTEEDYTVTLEEEPSGFSETGGVF